MQECYEYTDLEWRLGQIPDSACCRGVFFNMLDQRAGEFGDGIQRQYRDFFRLYQYSSLRLYPVKDYLTRIVKLSQLQFGGPNIYRGIFEIQAAAFPAWRQTLIGRTAFAMLGSNFDAILRMAHRNMQKANNYARFTLSRDGDLYIARFEREYNYIEHAMAGALWGIARGCGKSLDLQVNLSEPFTGDLRFRPVEKAASTP